MIVTIEEKICKGAYQVTFHHTQKDTELKLKKETYYGVWKTSCKFQDLNNEKHFWNGITLCSPRDQFSKEEGRKHAFTKAIKHLNRETRRQLWFEYYRQTKPRYAQIIVEGNWKYIPFKNLKEGDIFRLRSKTEDIVNANGEVQIATSQPFFDENAHVWSIQCTPFTREAFLQINNLKEL